MFTVQTVSRDLAYTEHPVATPYLIFVTMILAFREGRERAVVGSRTAGSEVERSYRGPVEVLALAVPVRRWAACPSPSGPGTGRPDRVGLQQDKLLKLSNRSIRSAIAI